MLTGPPIDYRAYSGTSQSILTDEDTEADAIARLLAGAGGTWSAWSAAGSSSCLSSYEQRTSMFTFAYQPAQFRLTIGALSPSTAYHVSVNIKRSVRGAGIYTVIATNVYAFTTDGSGGYQFSDDIPLLIGYDTIVDFSVGAVCVYT